MNYKLHVYIPPIPGLSGFGKIPPVPPTPERWITTDIFIKEKYIQTVAKHPKGWSVTLVSGDKYIISPKPKIRGL